MMARGNGTMTISPLTNAVTLRPPRLRSLVHYSPRSGYVQGSLYPVRRDAHARPAALGDCVCTWNTPHLGEQAERSRYVRDWGYRGWACPADVQRITVP